MDILQGVLLLLGSLLAASDPPATRAAPPEEPRPAAAARPAEKKPASPTLEQMKLPGGAVLLLVDEMKDALRLVPRAVVLTPEKYQELLEQIEQLKRQARPDRAETPSSCRLTVQVEGDLARIRAVYAFRTDRPRARVTVGGQRAWPTSAALDDGQIPVLEFSDEGWIAQVDTPGQHELTLELVQHVAARGSKGLDRGVDLGLPRAAITTLDRLDVPNVLADVRVGGRAVRARRVEGQAQTRVENVTLGPVDRLDVAWKAAAATTSKGPPLLTARSRTIVRVDDAHIFTDVELTLEVLRDETAVWRILVPLAPQATLEKPQLLDERVQSLTHPDARNPVLTVRLKEPSAEPLRLTLQVRQPRVGTPVAIGPFVVLDALPQGGTVEVRAAPGLRLRYQLHGEVSQREVTEEQRREQAVAAFAFWNLAAGSPMQPAIAPVTLEVEPVKGVVEARVTHSLRPLEAESGRPTAWRVVTRVEASPVRTAVDRLQLQLPPDYEYDRDVGPSPAELVEDVVVDPQTRLAVVKLAQRLYRPFTISLVGVARPPAGASGSAGLHETAVELPRPVAWGVERASEAERLEAFLDRGGQLSVTLTEGLELVARGQGADAAATGTREATWQTERIPTRAEWAWRSHRAEAPVDATVDLTVAGRQVNARHQLRFAAPHGSMSQVRLRLRPELAATLRLVEGGKLAAADDRTQAGVTVLFADPSAREHVLLFTYSAPVSPGRNEVPLLAPEAALRGETKMRVWTDPGVDVSLAGAGWEELPVEAVAERPDSLPTLVARADTGKPLLLHLAEVPAGPLAATVIDRVLARVSVAATGRQVGHYRYLLSRVGGRQLDIELPGPRTRVSLEVLLDGRQAPWQVLDETGPENSPARVRVKLDSESARRTAVLELHCVLDPERPGGEEMARCLLRPPRLVGATLLGRTAWAVELPSRRVPLPLDADLDVVQHWAWRGWLLAPQPALSAADLEQWFGVPESSGPRAEDEPSLVAWQAGLGPVELVHVPRQGWVLGCSLGVLLIGLGLFFPGIPRPLFWLAAAGLTLAASLVGLLWPGLLPMLLAGCQPGLVVLALVLAVQWMLQQRYHRQVVFMPGFTRLKAGSSLIRGPVARPRDASTVDQPASRIGPSSAEPRSGARAP